MAIGIFEIESTNSGGGFIACGDCLRSGRSVTHFVSAQSLIGFVHITHDNRDVLEGVIVAAPIGGNRSSLGRKILRQLDRLFSE